MADTPEPVTPGLPPDEEELLGEVLAELERERNRRHDIESKLRAMEVEERSMRDDIVLFRAQRDAFLDMVETLTDTNDAVAFATKSPSETLPLHEIHLLEAMPWDQTVQEDIAKKVDELYEWQVFDSTSDTWSNTLKRFPDDFQSLPVAKPAVEATTKVDGGKGRRNEPAPKAGVLTNGACTQVLNVQDGYPLPTRGTWRWVGGWKVELQHADGTPCDEDGWTYASQPKLLLSLHASNLGFSSGSFGQAGPLGSLDRQRIYRRRRWTRLRILVGYPSISEKSESFLYLLAKHASLELGATKLSDLHIKVQQELNQSEEHNWEMQLQIDRTTADLKSVEDRIQALVELPDREEASDHSDSCHPEPVDAEATKSFAFWHGIVGPAKTALSDTEDRTTEPSTSDEDSIQSRDEHSDEGVPPVRVDDGDGARGAFHWKTIGGGGGTLFNMIVSNMPAKPKHDPAEELKERLGTQYNTSSKLEEEVIQPKWTAAQWLFDQPTVRF